MLAQQIEFLNTAVGLKNASKRYGRNFGRVVAWKQDRAFGFIRQENGSPDVFFHIDDIINIAGGAVPIGAEVEFDLMLQADKERAICVAILSKTAYAI